MKRKTELKLSGPEEFIRRETINLILIAVDLKNFIEEPDKSLFDKLGEVLNYLGKIKERLRRIETQVTLLRSEKFLKEEVNKNGSF